MNDSYTATASITMKAKAPKVWKALTDPAIIKQYLYGTNTTSTWKVGASITYAGEWEGKSYEDKGKILEIVPNKLLRTTYWSSLSTLPDKPESYTTITYKLSESDGQTTLTITQDNNPTKESADHSAKNWTTVLQTMKAIVEK
jgi:uncharacterized protein YndB with AHSA1/START domain